MQTKTGASKRRPARYRTLLRSPTLAPPAVSRLLSLAVLAVVSATLAMFAWSASADAAASITYVASNGKDANPCTVITAPCKTLQRAVDVTSDFGTVRVLTPLQGSVTVAHPITIAGDSVTIVGQITIASTESVTLQGLALDGDYDGSFLAGILINSAAAVHIEHCTVERYTGAGIRLTANGTELFVSDTVARDNNDGLVNDKASVQVTIENSRFENNALRGIVLAATRATIVRSVVSGSFYGIYLPAGLANIVETTVANNGRGVWMFGSAVAILVSSV